MNAAETIISINTSINPDLSVTREVTETTSLNRDALAIALDCARRNVRYLESLMEFMDGR